MRITVFGCGYVGLTTAVGLAQIGHQVIGIDTDAAKISSLQKGVVPFFEPGLQKLLVWNIAKKRLQFSTNAKLGIQKSEVIFCAVAAPAKKKGTDLSAVMDVASAFVAYGGAEKIFINKSTVPVGTTDTISKKILPNQLVSNPEFLREGQAVQDFLEPDRIVIGLPAHAPKKLKETVRKIFKPLKNAPLFFTTLRNAEIIKYASNAFLATKISFVNELAHFCETVGGDIQEVTKGMSYDSRIGSHFLKAGIGFGGSCLPKDLNVFLRSAKNRQARLPLLQAVKGINDRQPLLLLEKLQKQYPRLAGKKVAIWGAAFKPNTDDLRDAPSLIIIDKLLTLRAEIQVYDPAALISLRQMYGNRLFYGKNAYDVLDKADALLLLTEWKEFVHTDFKRLKKLMRKPLILDGRNLYGPAEVRAQGFIYEGMGRA